MIRYLDFLLLTGQACIARRWETEVMAGLSGYSIDLTEQFFAPKSMGPAGGLTLKYNFNEIFIFRKGIAWGKVSGNDKNNRQTVLLKQQSWPIYKQMPLIPVKAT